MSSASSANSDDEVFEQRLSALVRTRLLFNREIDIDRASETPKFDQAYLLRVLEMKKLVDQQMNKLLVSATASTLFFYVLGKGMDPVLPIWGLKLTAVPGILIFITLFSAYAMAMAAYAFYNSQTYLALIDGLILYDDKNGVIDTDMIKASYETEWLIFKALRRDFSFYTPVHINYRSLGKAVNSVTLSMMYMVAMLPFLALIVAVPYLAATFLDNDVIGIATKSFVVLCVASVVFLMAITTLEFICVVKIDQVEEPLSADVKLP